MEGRETCELTLSWPVPILQQTLEEARGGREFSLMAGFPPNDVINDIDNTIEASGLKGQVLSVRWK